MDQLKLLFTKLLRYSCDSSLSPGLEKVGVPVIWSGLLFITLISTFCLYSFARVYSIAR